MFERMGELGRELARAYLHAATWRVAYSGPLALTLLIGLILFLALTACTTMTEEQRYERDVARIEAAEDYEKRKKLCREIGGFMVIDRRGVKRRDGMYRTHEYRTARCVRGTDF